ncbi:hypothetical protein T484DRAFT_1839638 [Baffinella frigidus]|nr:hypothetical protein T484DRAFT_1839638 [Cryptophyta sp. CCMP2293]
MALEDQVPRLALKLAAVLRAAGDPTGAMAVLEPALRIQPKHQGCLWAYGEALLAAGDEEELAKFLGPHVNENVSLWNVESLLTDACHATNWTDPNSIILLADFSLSRIERPKLASALYSLALGAAKHILSEEAAVMPNEEQGEKAAKSAAEARIERAMVVKSGQGGVVALLGLAQAIEADVLMSYVPPLDEKGRCARSQPLSHRA